MQHRQTPASVKPRRSAGGTTSADSASARTASPVASVQHRLSALNGEPHAMGDSCGAVVTFHIGGSLPSDDSFQAS
ncbi:MAG: hypothetical protein ACI92S_003372 [Planctomycetaceae bacterium]|jgi:hypothetical protein